MAQQLPPDPTAFSGIIAFQNMPAAVLDWLAQHGQLCRYASGEIVVTAGSPADKMLVVIAGGMQYFSKDDGRREPRFRVSAGQVSGLLPYSRLQTFRGEGVAAGETTLYILPRAEFAGLEQTSPELVQRLVGVMSDRARDEVRGQERDDKLRLLGKMAADLSHELNNPAAAIVRAAEALGEHLKNSPALLKNFMMARPTPEALGAFKALAAAPTEPRPAMSALEKADQEDALADWLDTQGVPDGYQLAAGLLEANLTQNKLAPLLALLPAPARPPALAWLEAYLTALRLTHDVREAGQRISTLVNDVKTYSHMDRDSGREKLDPTVGIDSTLNIFAYALRQKKVQLRREYAPGLPPVRGQVSSLNQVWTNLIDNALDAMPDTGGELLVKTEKQAGGICVNFTDNGGGITPEVLAQMFEPFYTTKAAGEGSGLGLDIARRIVREHDGRLEATSEPGRTVFSVWLPTGAVG